MTSLRLRNRQRVRDEIIEAAYAVFAERGYAEATVADITERAGVGRTTFFRYFGDKQEVLFAGEQLWLDDIRRRLEQSVPEGPRTLPQALGLLRDITAGLCTAATRDPGRYVLRRRLIAENPELGDREARKHRLLVELLSEALQRRGAPAETAALAPRLALACYQAGGELAGDDPAALWPHVAAAFDRLESIGRAAG
ncbi:TetR/AcrR family transcriptional regulator [Nonomuraea sp. NPDC049309]|uniref:TetR/AcrR family transcriptional regulator n=1 Tax=Nonomuraea sp. NPDC049309 TaxID=3364350 RepID=UPI0037186D0C